MAPSDMALVEDPKFKVWVELYAQDQERFFADFAAACTRLFELGVPAFHGTAEPERELSL
jgi:cytochrome c peroxidase